MLDNWYNGRTFKRNQQRSNSLVNFKTPFVYVAQLIICLYGKKYFNHLKEAWVSILHTIPMEAKVMNWGEIISHALGEVIRKARNATKDSPPKFFMRSYLLNMVYASNSFFEMGWDWSPWGIPIHVYC